jgi:hypothetical protein
MMATANESKRVARMMASKYVAIVS